MNDPPALLFHMLDLADKTTRIQDRLVPGCCCETRAAETGLRVAMPSSSMCDLPADAVGRLPCTWR